VIPLRLGITGCGRLAEAGYLRALEALPGLRLVAVADPRPDRRQLLAERATRDLGVRPSTHGGLTEMLDRAAPQALIVASPPGEHAGDAGIASRAGITALVEKPPAPDADGAAAIARLRHPPYLGFNRRFSGAAALRGRLAGDGAVELRLELRYRRATWGPVAVHDDAAADLAPHLVDLALWLTGAEAVEVRSAELREERARIEVRTARGTARIACATDRAHLELAEAVVDGTTRRAWKRGGTLRNALARVTPGEPALVASLRAQLDAYESALRGGSAGALAQAADGVAVMRVIDAARESRRAGGAAVTLAGLEAVA
jgi:predicted dehydrogenase